MVIHDLLEYVNNKIPPSVPLLKLYVDGIATLGWEDIYISNNQKFTVELEINSKIWFLDILITIEKIIAPKITYI